MKLWIAMFGVVAVEIMAIILSGDAKPFLIVFGISLVYIGIGILYARLYFNEPSRKYYGRQDQKEHDAKEVGFRFLFWPLLIPLDFILHILPMIINKMCKGIGELVCDFLGKNDEEDSTGLKGCEQVLQEEK